MRACGCAWGGANQYTGPAYSAKANSMAFSNITTTANKGMRAWSTSSLCKWDVYDRLKKFAKSGHISTPVVRRWTDTILHHILLFYFRTTESTGRSRAGPWFARCCCRGASSPEWSSSFGKVTSLYCVRFTPFPTSTSARRSSTRGRTSSCWRWILRLRFNLSHETPI